MIAIMLVLFVIGYLGIALEHNLRVNKATFALLLCGTLWAVYAIMSGKPYEEYSSELIHILGETCEVVIFLIGAMTLVELIDRYGGYSMIVHRIKAKNKRGLLWTISLMTFFLSAILDNLTTSIIMIMVLRRMLSDRRERWMFASVIVLSANAGGAWSPIGDVTTIMLWMKNYVTSSSLVTSLFLPSLAAALIPTWVASYFIKPEPVEEINEADKRVGYSVADHHPHASRLVFILGVLGLLFVPVFKAATHLPPYMGMLLSLGVLWLVTELVMNRYKLDGKMEGRISQVIRVIDMSTILFFLGILMAVAALSQVGILGEFALWLDETFKDVYVINGVIGILSAIIDNVPLVAAAMNMYPLADEALIAGAADPAFMAYFVQDGLFWNLLAFCAGFGGSMLIIGSAAGDVDMGF